MSDFAWNWFRAGQQGKVNPATGIHIHKNNPQGIKCTNELCANKPRADTHSLPFYYWAGSSMADKAPAWIQNKKKEKGKTAAAVVPPTATAPTTPLSTTLSLPSTDHRHDLSCTAIIED